jgi:hypothetical protein
MMSKSVQALAEIMMLAFDKAKPMILNSLPSHFCGESSMHHNYCFILFQST